MRMANFTLRITLYTSHFPIILISSLCSVLVGGFVSRPRAANYADGSAVIADY